MKKMLLKISYDGTDYHGWQVQPNAITVQQTLQDALEKLLGVRPNVTGCSRTDAGVHAKEFCCHFECDDIYPEITFTKGLNSVLPKDIVSISCNEVDNDFHARYSAKGKRYCYRIYQGEENPFICRYSWHIKRFLDVDKMNEFCKKIVGTHNFAPFSASARTVEDTIRTVSEFSCERCGDSVVFSISADGFLYNMVRILVGTAVEVSDGKIPIENVVDIFNAGQRELAGVTAPPEGLFLEKVFY